MKHLKVQGVRDVASTGRFFEMKFFWVPQGKFCEGRAEITRRGQKNKSQKIFFLRKRRVVVATSFFGSTFFGNEKKVEDFIKIL